MLFKTYAVGDRVSAIRNDGAGPWRDHGIVLAVSRKTPTSTQYVTIRNEDGETYTLPATALDVDVFRG